MGFHYHLGFLKISGFLIETYSELLLKIKVGTQIYFFQPVRSITMPKLPGTAKVEKIFNWGMFVPHYFFPIRVLYLSRYYKMDKLNKARLKQFGQHLAKLRTAKGLSLRELAARSDVDHKKISDIELSKRGLRLDTLFKLADGLEVQPKDLLDFEMAKQ